MKNKFLLLLLSIVFFSCSEVENTINEETFNPKNRNSLITDGYLIQAIKGQIPEYVDLGELEDLLIEFSGFSNGVKNELIKENRIPDYIVETVLILNAPLSQSNINHLATFRPSISSSNIALANYIPKNHDIYIVNSKNRVVLSGSKFTINSKNTDPGCGCGKTDYKIENGKFITVGSPIPSTAAVKKCDPSKHLCGTTKVVVRTGGDGNFVTVEVTCENSNDICVVLPRNAWNNY